MLLVEQVGEVGPRPGGRAFTASGGGVGPDPTCSSSGRTRTCTWPTRPRPGTCAPARSSPGSVRTGGPAARSCARTPVVRDLAGGVVPHHVGIAVVGTGEGVRIRAAVAGVSTGDLSVDEAVHLAVVDVGDRRDRVVRPARVAVVHVVVGPLANVRQHVRDAAREPPRRRSGQALGSRGRPEVRVERPVLLHYHDHVLDLVDALRGVACLAGVVCSGAATLGPALRLPIAIAATAATATPATMPTAVRRITKAGSGRLERKAAARHRLAHRLYHASRGTVAGRLLRSVRGTDRWLALSNRTTP